MEFPPQFGEICDCCGTHFGKTEKTIAVLRHEWIIRGAQFTYPQLSRVAWNYEQFMLQMHTIHHSLTGAEKIAIAKEFGGKPTTVTFPNVLLVHSSVLVTQASFYFERMARYSRNAILQ